MTSIYYISKTNSELNIEKKNKTQTVCFSTGTKYSEITDKLKIEKSVEESINSKKDDMEEI
jgi:hypothetical protein